MNDTIIKGTGDSRTLKTVADFLTRYPTYADFAAGFIAGTLPVDIGALVAAGVQQQGTPINTANLLSAATATALGLTSAATPNDALNKLKSLISAAESTAGTKAQIVTGSYVGTGTYGVNNPNSLSFSFEPKIVSIWALSEKSDERLQIFTSFNNTYWIAATDALTTTYRNGLFGILSNSFPCARKSSNGKTIEWYSKDGAGNQFNRSSYIYYYFAIG